MKAGKFDWQARAIQAAFVIVLIALWYYVGRNSLVSPIFLPKLPNVVDKFLAIVAVEHVLRQPRHNPVRAAGRGRDREHLRPDDRISGRPFALRRCGIRTAARQRVRGSARRVSAAFILFFGIGVESKIAFGAAYAFFPIALNTIGGISQVDPRFVTVARSMGASERQLFRRVLLPAALPVIVTGLRIGCTIGFLAILGSEMIAGLRGLGSRIVALAEGMNTAEMFAYIVFVIFLAMILNITLSQMQRRFGKTGEPRERSSRHFTGTERGGSRVRHVDLPAAQSDGCETRRRHSGVCPLELAGHTILDPNFLSPPSAIIQAMPRVLGDPGVQAALQASFIELVIAFALAVVAGVAIGLPIGLSGFAMRATLPLVLLLYAIPQVTILPLFVLYFGIGAGSKIAFGVSHGIFPIILNVIAGVQSVEAAQPHRGPLHGRD